MIEKLSNRTERRLSNRKRIMMAATALVLSGCSYTEYSAATGDVQCDGTMAVAEFGDDISAAFFVRNESKSTLLVSIRREQDDSFRVKSDVLRNKDNNAELVEITSSMTDGSADPDYRAILGDAVWSVDIIPEDSQVTISGDCD